MRASSGPAEQYSRTAALIGTEAVENLKASKVMIFGLGGVGSFAAEALARAGVGELVLVDSDVVTHSNRNRQLIALGSTVGMPKVEVMKQRIWDIDPSIQVDARQVFFEAACALEFPFSGCDYVVDAIDSMASKILLIKTCIQKNVRVVSAMGAGNKLYPEQFQLARLEDTSVDPIARKLRQQLRGEDTRKVHVVFSKEQPMASGIQEEGKVVPASISFVPGVMGMIMAGKVVRDLTGFCPEGH